MSDPPDVGHDSLPADLRKAVGVWRTDLRVPVISLLIWGALALGRIRFLSALALAASIVDAGWSARSASGI